MKRSNTQTLKEAINSYFKAMGIDKKLKEIRLVESWEDIVGITIAKSTRGIYIKNSVLYLKINSSIIRHELLMIREGLIKRVNEKAGEQLINRIVIN